MIDAYIMEPDTDPADIKPNTKVALDLHPAIFTTIEGHDADPLVGTMKETVAAAYAGIADFRDRLVAAKSDPLNSPLRAQVQVAGYVDKRSAEIMKGIDRARGTAERQVERLNEKMSAPVKPPEDAGKVIIHGEVRAHIKGLKKTERGAFVRQAIASGDLDTAVAALSGPAYLSGLSADERAHLEDEYRKAKFPEESAQLARLTKSIDKLNKAHALFVREMANVIDWGAVQAARQRNGRAA